MKAFVSLKREGLVRKGDEPGPSGALPGYEPKRVANVPVSQESVGGVLGRIEQPAPPQGLGGSRRRAAHRCCLVLRLSPDFQDMVYE